jgi:hypothetical protein
MLVRQQSIHGLPAFLRAMFLAAEKSGPAAANLVDVLAQAMQAKCVQCDMRIEGGELRTLSVLPHLDANAKLIRLLQGYCARNGCDSYYYHLMLSDRPGIDWHKLVALAECNLVGPEPEVESDEDLARDPGIGWRTYRLWASWTALGIVGVFLLLLMRQFYLGGTIPFIREPENFEVDTFESDWRPSP